MQIRIGKMKILALACIFNLTLINAQTPGFTATEYKKALWMTTRFYGGQRSGNNNWLLANHLPSGLAEKYRGTAFIEDKDTDGYDLSGGWHDCGDHVKFGQTEFYSGYMLLKGFAEFPNGYDDRYTHDYAGYKASNKWNFEDTGHDPNGIPDVLDEVKHATDYFIKCTRNSSTFYYQVGQGNPDHAQWVTAVKMQTLAQAQGGQPRVVYKNPADASMPSFCGATLALMARLYKKYDPTYAQTCLQHAVYAYDYAKAHPGVAATGDGGFYSANDNWKDDYVDLCAELFWATGDVKYKNEALTFTFSASAGQNTDVFGKAYGFDYSNNGDIAIYNLAFLGKSGAATAFSTLVTQYYLNSTQADGQFNGGNTGWGPLRYNANSAMMVALDAKLNGKKTNTMKYIYDNIDYLLGKNASNLSFVVGFGTKSVKFPHHRNVYLRDDNATDAVKRTFTIPTKNTQFGVLVGGTRNPGSFNDDLVDYTYTEGGIDYNACLVGALAYINSQLAPVDTTKFGSNHPVPALGADQSLCGLSNIILDAKIPTDGKKTFTWLNGTTVLVNASTTQNTYTVTTAGTYTCRVDSASKWQTEDQVVISSTLPTPNLGADKVLCDTASYALDARVSSSVITYEWWYAANGQVASLVKDAAQTAKTWTNVRKAGLYRVVVKASGCTNTQDDVTITSNLPTPEDGCAKTAGGSQTISIVNPGLSTGPYDWYTAPTSGTKVGTGTSISVSPSTTTTYYVQDASAISGSVGPKTAFASSQNWGINTGNQLKFTIGNTINISSFKLLADYYASSGTITVEVLDESGNALNPVQKFTSNTLSFAANSTGAQLVPVSFSNFTINKSWGTNLRLRISEKSSALNLNPYWNDAGATYPYNSTPSGIFTITGTVGGNGDANDYMYFYDIQFNSGAVCSRLPVLAKIDPNCILTDVEEHTLLENIHIFPNPSTGTFMLEMKEVADKIYVTDLFGHKVLESSNFQNGVLDLNTNKGGVYILQIEKDNNRSTYKLVKE